LLHFCLLATLGFPLMTNPMINWDRHAIAAEVHRRGATLTQLALDHGLGSSSCRSALCRATPRGDRVIAAFLGVSVHELWPDRYDVSGNRLRAGGKPSSIRGRRKPGMGFATPSSARATQDRVAEIA
jgi:Ner family transcriptional regulator